MQASAKNDQPSVKEKKKRFPLASVFNTITGKLKRKQKKNPQRDQIRSMSSCDVSVQQQDNNSRKIDTEQYGEHRAVEHISDKKKTRQGLIFTVGNTSKSLEDIVSSSLAEKSNITAVEHEEESDEQTEVENLNVAVEVHGGQGLIITNEEQTYYEGKETESVYINKDNLEDVKGIQQSAKEGESHLERLSEEVEERKIEEEKSLSEFKDKVLYKTRMETPTLAHEGDELIKGESIDDINSSTNTKGALKSMLEDVRNDMQTLEEMIDGILKFCDDQCEKTELVNQRLDEIERMVESSLDKENRHPFRKCFFCTFFLPVNETNPSEETTQQPCV